MKLFEQSTIAAAATPPVPSAIGIVRLSGPDALPLLQRVFHPAARRGFRPRRVTFGGIYDTDGTRIDEGLAVYMPGPGSYTGEDTAEIYCHGSPGIVALLLDTLYAAGARPAAPGEYTRRAFLNGRMDLSQSEAVIDLIESETRASAANAAAQLTGVLGKKLTAARDGLIAVASQLSAMIDFPEEEVPELQYEELVSTLRRISGELSALRESYARGAYLKNGVPCAITGRPNVGKSSLLNAFAGFDRAIVTDIPGTTRDVLEQTVVADGVKFSFFDTAGIRETADTVERIGVERAVDAMRRAALVLAVFDSSMELTDEDAFVLERAADYPAVCVLNKADLPRKIDESRLAAVFDRIYPVSAATGEGVPELLAAIATDFAADRAVGESLVTNPRQADALSRAADAVARAVEAAELLTADVVCTDVEQAAEILGEITGQTASEDIISQIFSRFCVGK
ncbi:MAG: tRNA uridine-5-carboxymethylaminomethyl(34) synthesis GTPase MnmE [Ruminococcaceae bacterium]|nr:tRNA uridine-5-carboxymethylaminomethyl(34) synthesis GTPase MnmE [Oscillospiraceae bacterium]